MKKARQQSGFTLIELTLVLGVSVMIASALVGMFNAHLQMMNQAAQYRFLAKDAPFIGLLLTKTIGNAEDYRIYTSRTAATGANGTSVLTDGSAVRLWMRQPNSTFRQAILSFESIGSHPGIYFFLADDTGTFPAAPKWQLAGGQLTGATFDASTGVLRVTLNGSYGDQYTFAAEKK
jgi:prepilin-type N-terminal cleavage/methylation domain-containing protein